MYKSVTPVRKCDWCKIEYIEEGEDICVECAICFTCENESTSKYHDELIIEDISEQELEEIGVSYGRSVQNQIKRKVVR